MTDVTVTVLDPPLELRLHRLAGAFLAGYRNANTRTAYMQQLHRWFAWCTAHQLDPLAVERTHVELYLRWFQRQVGSINIVCHGISVLASFYRWLVQTGQRDTTPIAAVRRPSRDETPRQTRLTRHELADWPTPPRPTAEPSTRWRACSTSRRNSGWPMRSGAQRAQDAPGGRFSSSRRWH